MYVDKGEHKDPHHQQWTNVKEMYRLRAMNAVGKEKEYLNFRIECIDNLLAIRIKEKTDGVE